MERINIKEYLAGIIGGCIGTVISHPFDTFGYHYYKQLEIFIVKEY